MSSATLNYTKPIPGKCTGVISEEMTVFDERGVGTEGRRSKAPKPERNPNAENRDFNASSSAERRRLRDRHLDDTLKVRALLVPLHNHTLSPDVQSVRNSLVKGDQPHRILPGQLK